MLRLFSTEYREKVSDLIEKLKTMINDFDEKEIQLLLLDIIKQILSASKIEGSKEIIRVSEQLENLISSIAVGVLVPNKEIKMSFNEGIKFVEDSINGEEIPNPDELIQKLQSIPKFESVNERDYFITKNVRVLYIDPDKFAQKNIIKRCSENMQIESCFSGTKALELLNSSSFDVVLCETHLSDIDSSEIFEKFAKKIPIVAISQSENTSFIQNVISFGVIDYVLKNENGIKWIPRAIHTAFNSWKKQKQSTPEGILEDPQVNKILTSLVDSDTPIKQTGNFEIEMNFSSSIGKYESKKSLELLVDSNILLKKVIEHIPTCPECNSPNIVAYFSCSNCNHSDFISAKLIEHYNCGNITPEETYQGEKCPLCKKEIEAPGVDYRTYHSYICNNCKERFPEPNQSYNCGNCNHRDFNLSNVGWHPLYEFSLNEEKINDIKKSIIPLENLKLFLKEKGFEVYGNQKASDTFQLSITPEIISSKPDQNIIVQTLGSELEENILMLTELDSLHQHISVPTSIFLIMFSTPSEILRNLLDKFDIIPILVEKKENLFELFKQNFSRSSNL